MPETHLRIGERCTNPHDRLWGNCRFGFRHGPDRAITEPQMTGHEPTGGPLPTATPDPSSAATACARAAVAAPAEAGTGSATESDAR